MHCNIEFIKQVFPIFLNPTGTYPKPPFIEIPLLSEIYKPRDSDYTSESISSSLNFLLFAVIVFLLGWPDESAIFFLFAIQEKPD